MPSVLNIGMTSQRSNEIFSSVLNLIDLPSVNGSSPEFHSKLSKVLFFKDVGHLIIKCDLFRIHLEIIF